MTTRKDSCGSRGNNFVHLSANFDSTMLDMLEDYNFAYANVPHFKDEKEFKYHPYERQSYSPELAIYDIRT